MYYVLFNIYNIYSLMMHCARSRKLSELVSSHHWPIRDEHCGHVTALRQSQLTWLMFPCSSNCFPLSSKPCVISCPITTPMPPKFRDLGKNWKISLQPWNTISYTTYLDIFNSKFKVSTGKARRETESVANFSQKVLKEFPCDKREVGESPRGTLKWNKNSILVQMWNRSPLVL